VAADNKKPWWTADRLKIAQMVAESVPYSEIAEKTGVSLRSVKRWATRPEFKARVQEIIEETKAALLAEGVRIRENRLRNLQSRIDKMHALMDARGVEMAETKEVAGGETGLLVRDYKGKDADQKVYRFDAALVKELREHEKQAAVEVGDWSEKLKLDVDLANLTDDQLSELIASLAGRKG
jgi:uncharacterized protein YjcR